MGAQVRGAAVEHDARGLRGHDAEAIRAGAARLLEVAEHLAREARRARVLERLVELHPEMGRLVGDEAQLALAAAPAAAVRPRGARGAARRRRASSRGESPADARKARRCASEASRRPRCQSRSARYQCASGRPGSARSTSPRAADARAVSPRARSSRAPCSARTVRSSSRPEAPGGGLDGRAADAVVPERAQLHHVARGRRTARGRDRRGIVGDVGVALLVDPDAGAPPARTRRRRREQRGEQPGRPPQRTFTASPARWPELRQDQLLHGEAQRAPGAGQHEHHAPAAQPRERAGEQRRGADLVPGEHAEQLAEARQGALEERLEGVGRDVARGDAGAAGHDQRAHLGLREGREGRAADLAGVVAHDRPRHQGVSRRRRAARRRARRPRRSRACACRSR